MVCRIMGCRKEYISLNPLPCSWFGVRRLLAIGNFWFEAVPVVLVQYEQSRLENPVFPIPYT